MAKVKNTGIGTQRNEKKESRSKFKKTRQGNSRNTKGRK